VRRWRLAARIAPFTALAAGAAALALSASGCGASESVDAVAQAARLTQSQPGARIVFSGEIVSPLAPKPLRFGGTGVLNNEPEGATLHYRFHHLVVGTTGATLTAEVRVHRHVFYLHFPQLVTRLGARQWLKIDEGRTARAAGLGSLPSADELDPDQYLTYLRAVSGGLTGIGRQVIHGVSTTGYRGEIELQRAAKLAAADRRSATVAAVGNLERVTGVHTIPFQVWIDSRNRVRRESFAEGESSTEPNASKLFVSIDFLRFGEQPRSPLPAKSDTFDASSLLVRAIQAELHPKRGLAA
jgi:hypothetical protein